MREDMRGNENEERDSESAVFPMSIPVIINHIQKFKPLIFVKVLLGFLEGQGSVCFATFQSFNIPDLLDEIMRIAFC